MKSHHHQLPPPVLIHCLRHDALAFVEQSFSLQGLVTAEGEQERWICHRSSPSVLTPWRTIRYSQIPHEKHALENTTDHLSRVFFF